MRKLGARNTADLVRKVLGGGPADAGVHLLAGLTAPGFPPIDRQKR